MKEIKINNNIKDIPVLLYDPNDNLIGTIENLYAFEDVRIQIMNQQLEGYYIIFENEPINIDHNGRLQKWPKGMFDTEEGLLSQLITGFIKNENGKK